MMREFHTFRVLDSRNLEVNEEDTHFISLPNVASVGDGTANCKWRGRRTLRKSRLALVINNFCNRCSAIIDVRGIWLFVIFGVGKAEKTDGIASNPDSPRTAKREPREREAEGWCRVSRDRSGTPILNRNPFKTTIHCRKWTPLPLSCLLLISLSIMSLTATFL